MFTLFVSREWIPYFYVIGDLRRLFRTVYVVRANESQNRRFAGNGAVVGFLARRSIPSVIR